jgi:hypothetical protein
VYFSPKVRSASYAALSFSFSTCGSAGAFLAFCLPSPCRFRLLPHGSHTNPAEPTSRTGAIGTRPIYG